jgi:hypothetical protein
MVDILNNIIDLTDFTNTAKRCIFANLTVPQQSAVQQSTVHHSA